jgi:hypothetical protein
LLSGFTCVSFQGKNNQPNIPEIDSDLTEYRIVNENQISPELENLQGNTRAGNEDYMNLVWEMGHGTEIGEENSITSADVDNDGIREVIFGNYEGYIHILQLLNGQYIDEWKSPYLGYRTFGLTTGDVDADGVIEIVVGTDFGGLFIIGFQPQNGSYMQEWSDFLIPMDVYALATGDINNDGSLEIIVGTDNFAEVPLPNVYVFGYDGTTYNLEWMYWAEDSYYNNVRSVAIGDVDSDGTIEFIVGISEYKYATKTPRGSFYVFGYNNGVYTLEWKRDDNSVDVIDIDCGDVDSDGIDEIVVGSGSVNIYGYESGLYHIENVIPEPFANVEVGNVNEDDILEVVVSSGSYLSIWQEDTEIWGSDESISQIINGIEIDDTDGNLIKEIIISVGDFFEIPMVLIFEFDGSDYKVEWESQYISYVYSFCIDDVDNDLKNELILGMDDGYIYFYGYEDGEYIFEDSIELSGFDYTESLFSMDFDNDGSIEIAAIIYDEIYFIEYVNGNYEIIDLVEFTEGFVNAADIGDVDNDGLPELIIGISGGNVYVIGYNGMSFTIEWQNQVYNQYVTALGIGDTNNNDELEIVLGGYDLDVIFTEYKIIILGYDGNGYVEKWSYQTDGRIDAVDVGDSDNDGINEIALMNGSIDLYLYGWDGVTYIPEWSTSDFIGIQDDCLDISKIEYNGENNLIIGEEELYVIHYDTTYEYLWQTDMISSDIYCLLVGNSDSGGSSEIVVSIGPYIFIFGKEIWPTASLYTSKKNVLIGEEITFDGSKSIGMGTLEYLFEFGDGIDSGWSASSSVTHSYTSKGTYIATLTIKDENGNLSTNPTDITIIVSEPNIPPTAVIDNIFPRSAKEGEEISFSGHGIDEDGTITSYLWESSIDGHLSSSETFTSLLSIGTHSIYFRVMDDKDSWSEDVTETVEIEPEVQNQIPTAYIDSVSPNPAIEGDVITFEGHGVDTDGTIAGYSWESDINGILNHENLFTIEELAVGTHTISFKVKDNNGSWSEEVSETLNINPKPDNQPPTVEIDAHDSDGTIVTYSWESNIDGLLSTDISFSTSSLSIGEHTITFKAKDDNGDWSESVKITLVVEKKEEDGGGGLFGGNEDEDNRLLAVIIGTLALIMAIVVATVFSLKRKKSDQDAAQMGCPSCGFLYTVTTPQRPVTVQCPSCGSIATINE